ncbi:hypothetical protein BXO88_14555 [Oribacterium sp. C9]|uniref:lipopolysaccharide biosynthesis protein n=1 Tax=Oribacterium sp. C9 TaxID=1943579 RepID=UPI00098FCDDD|nr:oligosaccharide flippase family protein [Oribacterium sp. C9]OON85005.1 hypothetical protein BXO88_14555 [Oribacterium sp. C9]
MASKRNNRESNNFLSQMLSFSLGPVFGAVFTFAASYIITWVVNPADVGKVSMFTTSLTLITLVTNLGLDRAYMREFSAAKDKNSLLFNCLSISILSSSFISILIFLFRESISDFLFDGFDLLSVLLLAFILPINVFGEYSIYVCRLNAHVRHYTIAVLSERISYLIIVVLAIFGIRTYQAIILARFLSITTKCLTGFVLERAAYRFQFKWDRTIISKVLKYGVPYMPALICSWVLHSMDKYALRMWSTYEEIGFYSTAYTIVSIIAILQSAFSSFWTPLAYKWYDEDKDVRYFEKVGRYITAVLMICCASIIVLRNAIFHLYKPEYMRSADMIPFLLFVISMETMSYVLGCGINLKRKTGYNTLASGLACVVNLIGNYILVPIYGGVGAAIATGISSIIFLIIKMTVSRALWYSFSLTNYIINIILMVGMAACALIFGKWYIDSLFLLVFLLYNYRSINAMFNIGISFIKEKFNPVKSLIWRKV